MFQKILIANRGEIACRVIATARRLGIRTVAVYSDADASAKHVALADEAVHVGPAPVAESYLQAGRIIDAARATGAEAIHPGYGFLSENPDFVAAVEAAGLVFVGPSAQAIRAMGLKDAAKALMDKAGVPVVPGYHGSRQEAEFLAERAEEIGYPVLIKARAGGGGKGMRLVERAGEFADALASAQREAKTAFGDPACLIEKFVPQPRHIEIQVFGDACGNVIHLFERDCSLQRRHQKVIEEAPAPDMPEEVRAAMGRAAVDAARAIGYRGAGTVEFIVDGSGPLRTDGFWFMEMNTRLQVEHPVSEAITGLDFVELQLRVAAGEPLPVAQDDLKIDGWAFEARLYAEDVAKGFLPATGRLDYLAFPEGTEFDRGPVRIDSGVRQGDEISPFYDPMIAKVIVHGPTRSAALNRLTTALEACRVTGSVTNAAFLAALSRHDGFRRGEVDTGLIARDLGTLLPDVAVPETSTAVAAVAALGLLRPRTAADPWERLAGWRHWTEDTHHALLERDGARIERAVTQHGRGRFTIDGPKGSLSFTIAAAGGTVYTLDIGNTRSRVEVVQDGARVTVFDGSTGASFELPDLLAHVEGDEAGSDSLVAPMPGLVIMIAAAGQSVAKGDALVVLEAMKMEHTLRAPRDGIVAEVLATQGDQVSDGTILLKLEAEDA
ncbi:acetyl/propionyl/methylcrotonyl-CoA carboxylase subunit alpha [uncultured Jannaschia sp.]|uniref:acetyl/propionyl/methylcrotonyl-CoA carboxylase subunit alpha n=1 Tax=uncultured Jannaschia sp. TaxID=293347 RepID=UPI00260E3C9A|nr:acetyl/propionyl/methylcrotonyl-CoA carboxylase subunit alpha [uncultured Jannaschia sp.]